MIGPEKQSVSKERTHLVFPDRMIICGQHLFTEQNKTYDMPAAKKKSRSFCHGSVYQFYAALCFTDFLP